MFAYTEQELKVLKELDITPAELHSLYLRLTDTEQEEVKGIDDFRKYVKKIAELLNRNKELPKSYAHLVTNYAGFEGVSMPNDLFYY